MARQITQAAHWPSEALATFIFPYERVLKECIYEVAFESFSPLILRYLRMSGCPKSAHTEVSKCERVWEGSRKLLTWLKKYLHARTYFDTL